MKKFIGIFSLIVILGVGLYVVRKFHTKNAAVVKEKQDKTSKVADDNSVSAVDFDFQDLNGRKYHLSDFKGKVIILNFRRMECPACEYELEFLKDLYNQIGNDNNIKLIPLFLGDTPEVIARYMKHKNINFSCYIDSYGLSAYKYRVYAVPTTFIIDKNFNIIKRAVGVADWSSDEIISWLQKLSNE